MNGPRLVTEGGKGLVGIVQQFFFPDIMSQFNLLAAKGDPMAFYEAARNIGYYDEEDIRGTPLGNYRALFLEGRNLVKIEDCQKYSKLAWIALKRFPELEPRDSIGVSEIRNRLRQLKDSGYEVKGYNTMNKDALWKYWMSVKQDIRRYADVHCPGILVEIDRANKVQIEDARNHL